MGLKEMKALIEFCTTADVDNVHCQFTDRGCPFLLHMESVKYSAELFLSTMNSPASKAKSTKSHAPQTAVRT